MRISYRTTFVTILPIISKSLVITVKTVTKSVLLDNLLKTHFSPSKPTNSCSLVIPTHNPCIITPVPAVQAPSSPKTHSLRIVCAHPSSANLKPLPLQQVQRSLKIHSFLPVSVKKPTTFWTRCTATLSAVRPSLHLQQSLFFPCDRGNSNKQSEINLIFEKPDGSPDWTLPVSPS